MKTMNIGARRLCVWCGPFMIAVWATTFTFMARMIPPPDPQNSPAEVVARLQDHTTVIQIGLVISLFACALLVPYCAVIAAQMRRMEGSHSVLAETQLVSGGLLCVEFLIPFAIWQTACYRINEWDPQMVQMLNDMAWLMFLGIICSAVVQVASVGVAILRDSSSTPAFPRWFGYYNLWISIMWIPSGWIPLFKSGPLAWNGLFAWWIPLTVYFTWFVFMTYFLLRAIRDDEHTGQATQTETATTTPVAA